MSSGILVAILSLSAMAGGSRPAPPARTNGLPFHLSGYIQGRFTNARDTPDRFEVRRARLLLNGDLNSRISYLVQGDILKLPGLLDADVEFKAATVLKFTAGQFKLPFSLSSLISGTFGSSHAIDYWAGVFSGELLINSPRPQYRAVSTRAVAHLWRGLQIGGDMYKSFSAPAHKEKMRQSAEVRYARGPLTMQAEYLWGRDGTTDRRGGYALGVWRWSKKWEGVARDDWYTSNVSKANTRTQTWLAGANYYLWPKVRIQANGGLRQEPASVRLSGVFLTQLQMGF